MYGTLRNFGLWLLIVLLLLALFTFFQNPAQRSASGEIAFSEFLDMVDRGNVRAVEIDGPDIQISTIDGRSFRTAAPNDPTLVQRLYDKRVIITARSSRTRDTGGWLESLVISWLPFVFLVGVWIFLARSMRRGRAAPLDFFLARGPRPRLR